MNETNEAAASNDGSGETSEADGSEGGSETAHVCKVIPGSTDGSGREPTATRPAMAAASPPMAEP